MCSQTQALRAEQGQSIIFNNEKHKGLWDVETGEGQNHSSVQSQANKSDTSKSKRQKWGKP